MGHFLAWGANSYWYHTFLSRFGVTSRTSRPSQWFSAFHGRRRFVVLHLSNGRRLQGWPNEWPDNPKEGHFLIEEPARILDDNSIQPVLTDDVIVIEGRAVEMVEFLRNQDEVASHHEEIEAVEKRLIVENEKEGNERTESETTSSKKGDSRRTIAANGSRGARANRTGSNEIAAGNSAATTTEEGEINVEG